MQALVADAKVVGNLVNNRHRNFMDDLLVAAADFQNGAAENGDPVRQ